MIFLCLEVYIFFYFQRLFLQAFLSVSYRPVIVHARICKCAVSSESSMHARKLGSDWCSLIFGKFIHFSDAYPQS